VISFLLFPSFSFDSSVAGFFWTLCQGGTLLLPQDAADTDIVDLGTLLHDQQATHWLSVPSVYRILLEERAEDLRALHTTIIAGEACAAELVRRHYEVVPSAVLFNEYGPTEATVWSSVHRCVVADGRNCVPIGRPIANARIFLLDPDLTPVPTGVAGEVHIAGSGVAAGYHHRPDLTAAKFIPDPYSPEPGGRLFRTGDLARHAPDASIEFVGRRDQQVKVRGHRVELVEVETALREHPAVREAVVLPRHDTGHTRLTAYVVLEPGYPGVANIDAYLRRRLPDYMVPSSVTVLQKFPLNAHGKIDRARLPDTEIGIDAKIAEFLNELEQLPEEHARTILAKVAFIC
jgi:amino acid adenylation domain-containing protein